MKKIIIAFLFALFIVTGIGSAYGEARAVNPCSVNPCAARPAMTTKSIRRDRMVDIEDVKSYGEDLWVDTGLGKSGLSCSVCHPDGKGLKRGTWPKFIKMGNDIYTLDQMINFCMLNPMKAKPLKWNLQKMTALAYYVSTHSNEPEAGEVLNPCAANPCAVNPCAVNPSSGN